MYCRPMVDVGLTGHPPAGLYQSSGQLFVRRVSLHVVSEGSVLATSESV
jgi:hypothetical protein